MPNIEIEAQPPPPSPHLDGEDPETFSAEMWPRTKLRPYQLDVAKQIIDAIERGRGGQFAVVFARQSGKDELLAQLIAYLLARHSRGVDSSSIVMVAPTLRPQGMIARRRLLDRLAAPGMAPFGRHKSDGNVVSLGRASCSFLSAHPYAQARGETANLLLNLAIDGRARSGIKDEQEGSRRSLGVPVYRNTTPP